MSESVQRDNQVSSLHDMKFFTKKTSARRCTLKV
jgi:hypothetical protein